MQPASALVAGPSPQASLAATLEHAVALDPTLRDRGGLAGAALDLATVVATRPDSDAAPALLDAALHLADPGLAALVADQWPSLTALSAWPTPGLHEAERWRDTLASIDLVRPASAPTDSVLDQLFAASGHAQPDSLAQAPANIRNALAMIVQVQLALAQAHARGVDASTLATLQRTAIPVLAASAALLPCTSGLVDTTSPVLQYDLTCTDTTYTTDTLVLVDNGGDDLYLNNAGGGACPDHCVALAIDVDGADRYEGVRSEGAVNGGARNGVGLLLDLSGDDHYAPVIVGYGAANGGAFGGSGLLVDLDGHDTYDGSIGGFGALNGAGHGEGTGTLIDHAGDDLYTGSVDAGAMNGAGSGIAGARGLLVDDAGNDVYRATLGLLGAVNGAGYETGHGTLVDRAGNDLYNGSIAKHGAINGASALGGRGQLVDHSGDDRYEGIVYHENFTVAVQGAINGAAVGGAAQLFDASGNDAYHGEVRRGSGAINGAGFTGTGNLVDLAGDDVYTGLVGGATLGIHDGAINGAGMFGSGSLVDVGGNDRYAGVVEGDGGVNGGAHLGVGLLLDGGGSDTYEGEVVGRGGANGGAHVGAGILIDLDGTNHYTASVGAGGSHGAATGVPVAPRPLNDLDPLTGTTTRANSLASIDLPGGVGILLAGPGDDTYESSGVTQGAGNTYGVGVLVDLGGTNSYRAGPEGLAQGAGRHGGLGVLVDHGTTTRFELDGTTIGQGAGLQGVGLLARTASGGATTYVATGTALPALTEGAGIGLRSDLSATRVLDYVLVLTCSTETHLGTVPTGTGGSLDVCSPEEDTGRQLVNPLTGQPVGPLDKPGVPCPPDSLCDTIVGATPLGPDAQGWLEANEVETTTGGGLLLDHQRSNTVGTGRVDGILTTTTADGMCRMNCDTIRLVES